MEVQVVNYMLSVHFVILFNIQTITLMQLLLKYRHISSLEIYCNFVLV